MSISSRHVPSNYAVQGKTLNTAGSKGFLGVRLPVHNTSSILGVIWERTPQSLSERIRTLRALYSLLDTNISNARGMRLVAGVMPYFLMSLFMVLRVV